MKFKPFTKTFDFHESSLIDDFPEYLAIPVAHWVEKYLHEREWMHRGQLDSDFVDNLRIHLRSSFSQDWREFILAVLDDSELTANLLALLIQNCSNPSLAEELENILKIGGSAYKVEITVTKLNQYHTSYDYEFVHRVPQIVQDTANNALTSNKILRDAWDACYQHKPDYSEVVRKCCDLLEHLLRDTYEPKNKTPQLGMLLKNLQATPSKLSFRGDTLLDNKATLITLVEKATTVRGGHTAGTGRLPTGDEAEFILHSTILIWNMHQK